MSNIMGFLLMISIFCTFEGLIMDKIRKMKNCINYHFDYCSKSNSTMEICLAQFCDKEKYYELTRMQERDKILKKYDTSLSIEKLTK